MSSVVFRVGSYAAWRTHARGALARDLSPDGVEWENDCGAQTSLFGIEPGATPAHRPSDRLQSRSTTRVPARFLRLAETVACHRDPQRWRLLYQAVWRMSRGEPDLLQVSADPLVAKLARLKKSVDRDVHKMHAFVRFQRVDGGEGEQWIAWFEPDHHIVERVAGFFVDRFHSMRFSIFTPSRSLHWNTESLWFGEGVQRDQVVGYDALEEMWRIYYASTYNPSRTRWKAMVAEMPMKYWRNLPEASVIQDLARSAEARVDRMLTVEPVGSSEDQRSRKRDRLRARRGLPSE